MIARMMGYIRMKSPKTTQELFRGEAQAWVEEARATALKLLETRQTITIETVLEECPRPSFIHRNKTGHIFMSPDFQPVGYTKAKKPSSNGRVIRLWARRVV